MTTAGQFCVPASHPCLPGHFPGRPVVPGVVLLEEALALVPNAGRPLSAKFTAPVLPDETVDVTYDVGRGRITFSCAVGARLVLHGTAEPA